MAVLGLVGLHVLKNPFQPFHDSVRDFLALGTSWLPSLGVRGLWQSLEAEVVFLQLSLSWNLLFSSRRATAAGIPGDSCARPAPGSASALWLRSPPSQRSRNSPSSSNKALQLPRAVLDVGQILLAHPSSKIRWMSEQDFSPAPKSGGCQSRISAQLQRNLQAPWGRCAAFPPALPHPPGAGKRDIQRNLHCRNGIGQSRVHFGAFPLFLLSPVSRLPKYPIIPGNPSEPLAEEETQCWKVSKESLFFWK